jgi:predicted metalloendopeptidase
MVIGTIETIGKMLKPADRVEWEMPSAARRDKAVLIG